MGGEGLGALGEAVTGGLAARAVEPSAGEGRGDGHGACLNCFAELIGPHCHQCGQAAHVPRTVAAWWHDLAHGVLHLDGKIWRTLPLLAWRPGELTRRYVDGERAKFVSPLALFLFSVFLMFAIFSLMGAPVIGREAGQAASNGVAAEIQQSRKKVEALTAERDSAAAKGLETKAIDARLAEAKRERDALAAMHKYGTGRALIETDVQTGWQRLDNGIQKATHNPELLLYKVQTNAYKFSWALIPLSLPFVWMLFLHRRRYRERYNAYDHLVFVTYSIAFMSLTLIAFIALRTIGLRGQLLNLAFLLIPPIHMYRQLRGAYLLSRFGALWRTFVLLNFTAVTLTLFMLLLLALGVLA